MILYPAIDIRGGKAVRLTEGDFERETAYHDDPVDAALRFAEAGVRIIHVVDLDGARSGRPVNVKTIRRIADAVPFPIEVGGGLRDAESIADLLRAGAERVVIGTAAMRDPRVPRRNAEAAPGTGGRLGRRPRRQDLAGRVERDRPTSTSPTRSPT